ncbi:uncharacterized protein HaLaN_14883, partial [Haematococcus lacustris]
MRQVMKLEQLAGKTPEEIGRIWLQHHSELSSRGRAGTVMSGEDWQLYQERARKSP